MMRVCFIYAEKDGDEKAREEILADAFMLGVAREGDEASKITKSEAQRNPPEAEIVCMVGVKSLKLFQQMRGLGKQVIYFDKGYFRHRGPNRTWEYWRMAVNDHHPTDYVGLAKHRPERWRIISGTRSVVPKEWRAGGSHIIYAGSSEKYHAFAGLPEPNQYAESVIKSLKRHSDRVVIYRPKPTWFDAEPIKGSIFSPRTESVEAILNGCWCLVTNGSNASFDAILAGIPCIVLGNAIARPICSNRLENIENPRIPTDAERDQWLANLAWCMFTEAEMRAGLAWKWVKPQLTGDVLDDSTVEPVIGKRERASKALLKRTGRWHKKRIKRTKEEQRRTKPFTKGKNSGPASV